MADSRFQRKHDAWLASLDDPTNGGQDVPRAVERPIQAQELFDLVEEAIAVATEWFGRLLPYAIPAERTDIVVTAKNALADAGDLVRVDVAGRAKGDARLHRAASRSACPGGDPRHDLLPFPPHPPTPGGLRWGVIPPYSTSRGGMSSLGFEAEAPGLRFHHAPRPE